MLLLTVDTWCKTEDGRWYVCRRVEYYLPKPHIEKRYLMMRNPQKLEEADTERAEHQRLQDDGCLPTSSWWRRKRKHA